MVAPDETAAAVEAEPPAATGSTGKAAARSRYRDALRHRDLRLLISSFLVDQIGSWSYAIVISVYIFDRTHSTLWLAAAGICRWAPGLVLASYGGVIADRYQRTTVMIVSSLTAAVLMAGMAVVVATDAPVVLILVLLALSAAALAPYRPASGALIPEIVGEKDLAAANSIFAALENLVVVLGPGIGGLLLLTGEPVIGVAINGASFVIAAGLVARLRVRSTGGATEGNALQQFAAGLKELRAQPVAVAVILFCALDSAVYGASTVIYIPLSVKLGTGPTGYSYLLAGQALGGVLAAVLANRLSGASRLAPVIMGSICIQALPFLAIIPVHSPEVAFALQVVSGVGMVIVDVLAITVLQRDLPRAVLSRVLGIFDTVVLAGIMLASLGAGILLAHAGVNVALIAVGVGIPAIGLIGLPTLVRADRTSAAVAKRLRPRVDLLSALDLLAGADRNALERLAAAAEEVVLPAGRVVIREGDEPDALWILERGELSVYARGDGPTPREVGLVTAPGYVGELGLLHGIPRTATVQTREESTLLRIDGKEFLSTLQASRPSASLLAIAGTRMARTLGPSHQADPASNPG